MPTFAVNVGDRWGCRGGRRLPHSNVSANVAEFFLLGASPCCCQIHDPEPRRQIRAAASLPLAALDRDSLPQGLPAGLVATRARDDLVKTPLLHLPSPARVSDQPATIICNVDSIVLDQHPYVGSPRIVTILRELKKPAPGVVPCSTLRCACVADDLLPVCPVNGKPFLDELFDGPVKGSHLETSQRRGVRRFGSRQQPSGCGRDGSVVRTRTNFSTIASPF